MNVRLSRGLVFGLLLLVPAPGAAQIHRLPPPADHHLAAVDRPGWSIDAHSGCWIWNAFPQPNETVSWSGSCGPDGRAVGRGTTEWRYNGKITIAEGDYRDGRLHGHGVVTTHTGDRYEGEWRKGQRHGWGTFLSSGGDFEGEYRNNKKHGSGVERWANGDRYEGQYRDGRPDGFGEAWISGARYAGRWAAGCFTDGERRVALGRPLHECP